MTENKFTDNEIIKALELCKQNTVCTECPYISTKMGCQVGLIGDALDLITRQKAEIEQYKADKEEYIKDYAELENEVKFFKADRNFEKQRAYFQLKENEFLEIQIKKAKSEAVKEFAERLKDRPRKHLLLRPDSYYKQYVRVTDIDNLVKEMEGEG